MVECDMCKYREIVGQNKFCRWNNAYIGWHGCENGERKPITNADRIRAMSDEELAEWASAITLDEFGDKKDWLDWLRQEVNQNEGSDNLNA